LYAARIIIGTESKWAEELLKKIYEPFNLPIVSVNRRSAEMIKYASNDFLALKISYMNDIANLCELVGANIQDVAKGMSFDERIGSKFLNAGIGYGGSCFPKDTKALEYLARLNGYETILYKSCSPSDYKKLMRTSLVYDGRNIYDVEEMANAGVEYYSIGRPHVKKNSVASLAEVAAAEV